MPRKLRLESDRPIYHVINLGDQRVRLARRLRQETTINLKWIAQRLQMGSWTHVSNLLNAKSPTQVHPQGQLPLCQ